MTALDGQRFEDQSEETRRVFEHYYDMDAAEVWEGEHNETFPARDGQTFAQQSLAVIDAFVEAYGNDAAEVWVEEHNAALTPPEEHFDNAAATHDESRLAYGCHRISRIWRGTYIGSIDGLRKENAWVIEGLSSHDQEVARWDVTWMVEKGMHFYVRDPEIGFIFISDGWYRVYDCWQTDRASAERFIEYSDPDQTRNA
jgi:hypothetical protein